MHIACHSCSDSPESLVCGAIVSITPERAAWILERMQEISRTTERHPDWRLLGHEFWDEACEWGNYDEWDAGTEAVTGGGGWAEVGPEAQEEFDALEVETRTLVVYDKYCHWMAYCESGEEWLETQPLSREVLAAIACGQRPLPDELRQQLAQTENPQQAGWVFVGDDSGKVLGQAEPDESPKPEAPHAPEN